ncbi:NAD(P)-dependent oxidoreductase [Streptomyces sp. NPDC002994]|uniref:NAD-dependent epimerase/dehydratase family protein n=1 Tax=Streptomyces sp. NPDC002994 TaxID=3154441 RepID=UPI0033A46EB7
MRVLLLGSTGYLGRHTAERLRALADVRLFTGGRSPSADVPFDLADGPGALADALHATAPSVVINCAGLVTGSPVRLVDANARGPAALCEALREAAPDARLVHLGSAAEYGPGAPGRPVTEEAATSPLGLYGATKLAGTLAVTGCGLDAVVLRVFNPVGPGAPAAGLPGRLAAELRAGGDGCAVKVGNLSAYRDFVDARDVAGAVVQAATATGALPPVLNIGSGTATAVRDMAHGLLRASGLRGRLEESGAGSERSAAVSWQCADISAARSALGWRPDHSLADSLRDLWESSAVAVR